MRTEELENGIELSYPLDPTLGAALMSWVVAERRCCPFLTFDLRVVAGDSRIRLILSGPEGTLDVLRAAFASATL